MDIGLYEDGKQNEFEQRTAINYIIDIVNIVLNSVAICFVLRIKRSLNKNEQPVIPDEGVRPQINILPGPPSSLDNFNQNRIQINVGAININQNNNFSNNNFSNNNFSNYNFPNNNFPNNNFPNNNLGPTRLPPINNPARTPNIAQQNDLPSFDEINKKMNY